MFTGIIEGMGSITAIRSVGQARRLAITADYGLEGTRVGDSIAVSGACLTAVMVSGKRFEADVSPETIARTTFGEARAGERVNLERALRLGSRLGGHLVQGHVDTVVRLLFTRPEGGFQRWRISLPAEHAREVAQKGSVCIHGVSLTVATLGSDWFEVALIPATLEATNLGRMRSGTL
ncbi:MAG: riboflavin synthase, partial [Desulfobacterales bacterium]